MTSAPVRVVVVAARRDRDWLAHVLETDGTTVVAATGSPDIVVEVVIANDAEVVVVDLGLEGAGGLDAITQIMRMAPRPVLALIPPDMADTSEALDAGALGAYRRPTRQDVAGHALLRGRVRSLRDVSVLPRSAGPRPGRTSGRPRATRAHPAGSGLRPSARDGLPLVGLAGAPSAVASLLGGLGEVRFPVIVSVRLAREMVDGFTAFLNRRTALRIEAARAGSTLRPGVVFVASSDRIVRVGSDLRIRLLAASEEGAADELFGSVAEAVGVRGVGVLLTGTDGDGTAGLCAVRRAGGAALVQDTAATMSGSLPDVRVLPLGRIAAALREAASRAEA